MENQTKVILAIAIIIAAILIIPKLNINFSSVNTDFTIVGQDWKCNVYPQNTINAVAGQVISTSAATQGCSNGQALFDVWTGPANSNPYNSANKFEVKNSLSYTCPSGQSCIAEVYCCPQGLSCSSNADCSWKGTGSQCLTKNEVDPIMPLKDSPAGSQITSYKYCSPACSGNSITCWSTDDGCAASRTYDCSYATYPNCPTSRPYNDRTTCLGNVCTPDNSKAATTCIGQTFTNNCGKTVQGTKDCSIPDKKCSDCGNGIWNLCDKAECEGLGNCEFVAQNMQDVRNCYEKCPEGTVRILDGSCSAVLGKKLALTAGAWNVATSTQIVQSYCMANEDCAGSVILTDETQNQEDYNWTVTCIRNSQIADANIRAIPKWLYLTTNDAQYSTMVATQLKQACNSAGFWDYVSILPAIAKYYNKDQCQSLFDNFFDGTCRATPKPTSGGFCVQSISGFMKSITGSSDCQSNTLLFIAAIIVLLVLTVVLVKK